MRPAAFTALLLLSAPVASAQEAASAPLPEWEICNETSYILRVATAVMRNGAMTPKGWDRARPGQCIPIDAPEGSPRYVFAESSPVHQGGIREWKGDVPLCTAREDFTADATLSCTMQNLETQAFLAVRPEEQRTTLIEPDNFGLNAETAGLQRLLRDNGYQVTRIDGLPGRRTSRTLREFRKTLDLPADTPNAEILDALADAAKGKQGEIGFEICNTSSARIWTAMATRDDGAWKSRGWWTVEPEACLRPFTKSLQGTEAHYYALQENIYTDNEEQVIGDDKRLRSASATPAQFCVAESKFSALGREYCAEAGYAVANFRPLPTDKDGAKVTLTDQDFAEPSPVGLRR